MVSPTVPSLATSTSLSRHRGMALGVLAATALAGAAAVAPQADAARYKTVELWALNNQETPVNVSAPMGPASRAFPDHGTEIIRFARIKASRSGNRMKIKPKTYRKATAKTRPVGNSQVSFSVQPGPVQGGLEQVAFWDVLFKAGKECIKGGVTGGIGGTAGMLTSTAKVVPGAGWVMVGSGCLAGVLVNTP